MNRKIAQGSDGWYYNNEKIEPTESEIQEWHDSFCKHCSMGSIMPKIKDISEQCKQQVPCPVCLGTGMKNSTGRYHKWASNAKVESVSSTLLDANNFCPKRKITVSFDYQIPSQQDGRPPNQYYSRMLKILHIGTTVMEALETEQKKRDQEVGKVGPFSL